MWVVGLNVENLSRQVSTAPGLQDAMEFSPGDAVAPRKATPTHKKQRQNKMVENDLHDDLLVNDLFVNHVYPSSIEDCTNRSIEVLVGDGNRGDHQNAGRLVVGRCPVAGVDK